MHVFMHDACMCVCTQVSESKCVYEHHQRAVLDTVGRVQVKVCRCYHVFCSGDQDG